MRISDLITGVRHIGIIVDSMDTSLGLYKSLFDIDDCTIRLVPPAGEPAPDTRFAFLPIATTELELIEPVSEHFRNLLGNPRPGINHIAFTVSDIDRAVALMHAKGVRLGHVTKNGILDMKSSRVAYFNPDDTGGILIEFVQPADTPPPPHQQAPK